MKKNSPASIASSIVGSASRKTNMRYATWYDRISAEHRAVVDRVIDLCNKQPSPQWYVVAESLIDTLKIPAKRQRVCLVLKELSVKRGGNG